MSVAIIAPPPTRSSRRTAKLNRSHCCQLLCARLDDPQRRPLFLLLSKLITNPRGLSGGGEFTHRINASRESNALTLEAQATVTGR